MDSAFSFLFLFFFFLSFFFNYQGKTPHKIDRSASKAFIEYLLNYKTFSGFPSLEKTAADLTGPTISSRLIFLIRRHENQLSYFSRFFSFKVINFWRIRQNHFWKEIFISTERKNIHSFWQVGYFKWRRFLSSTLYFFYCNLNSNSGLRQSIKSSLITLWNFLSFPVSQFVTSLEPPALTFYNLALFYIYGSDGTTISRRGVIINLKKYHWEKVQKGIP